MAEGSSEAAAKAVWTGGGLLTLAVANLLYVVIPLNYASLVSSKGAGGFSDSASWLPLTLSLSALLVAGCVLLTWIAGRRVAALQSLTQARSRRWQQANTAVLLAGLILLAGTAAIALMNSSLPEPRTSWHPVEDSFWLIAGSSVVFILSASLSALIRRTRKAPAFTSI